jgi:hypothetical protein
MNTTATTAQSGIKASRGYLGQRKFVVASDLVIAAVPLVVLGREALRRGDKQTNE